MFFRRGLIPPKRKKGKVFGSGEFSNIETTSIIDAINVSGGQVDITTDLRNDLSAEVNVEIFFYFVTDPRESTRDVLDEALAAMAKTVDTLREMQRGT